MKTWNPAANDVFLKALDRRAPAERSAFLDEACRADPVLRAEVEALLVASDEAGGFLESPLAAVVETVDLAAEAPGTVIGPYKLLEQIGEGGFGVVFMAEQARPVRRKVALKVLKPGMDTRQVVARFEAERQALALMDHPNIAKVLDAGATDTGRPYFVMELVRGIPVTEFCDKSRLAVRDRLGLFVSVCRAVQHAHQKGVIHRDLKPTNVLVTLHDGVPVPQVIDFGIAKAVGQPLTDKTLFTGFAQMVGTPLYMSPEQAEMSGLDVDTRSDVYSLGVMLYELLTGTTPFDRERFRTVGYDEVRRIIREEEPARPSARLSTLGLAAATVSANRGSDAKHLSRSVRGELDWIVMRALEKDRNRRYESVSALAADVQRYLADEPVLACPPTIGYRVRKFARRNKGPVLAAGVVSLGLFGGLVGAAYGAVEARNKREVAGLYGEAVDARRDAEAARDAEGTANLALRAARDQLAGEEYGRTMQVALQECLDNNVPAALALLDRTRPEFRGWEWWYVRRLCNSELLTLRPKATNGTIGTVTTAVFSPDGTRVVVGFVNFAAVMDAATGETLLVLTGHTAGVGSVAINRQGTRIVTGSYDGTAKVWDARTGKELLTFKHPKWVVLSVSFSPDGAHVLSAGSDHVARVWDATTGVELRTFKWHTRQIDRATYSPDGTRIVTASEDQNAVVWDAKTGAKLFVLNGHTNSLTAAAFSPDGTRIVTASYDRTARVWDAETGGWLRTLYGHTDYLEDAAFSPDGARIVTGNADMTARVWKADTGREELTLTGHTRGVRSASFSPDGGRVLTAGGNDLTAKIWDAGRKAGGVTFQGHTYCVHSAAVSPDGLRVVSIGLDKAARLEDAPERMTVWDARTGVVTVTYRGDGRGFAAAAFSPDGAHVATACWDGTVRVWDSRTGTEVRVLKGHTKGLTAVAYNRDGTRIVTASYDRTARVWDAGTGVELLVLRGHTEGVQSAAFSPDGTRVVTAGDTTARVWDAKSGAELTALTHAAAARAAAEWPVLTRSAILSSLVFTTEIRLPTVRSAAYSPDGTRIVTACGDGTTRVWDARTGTEVRTLLSHVRGVRSAAYSPDGTRILTASNDRTVRLWDAKTGAEVLALKGHTHEIDSAAFSPDGVRIVTAGFSAVQVWDLSPPPKHQSKASGPTN